MKVLVYLFLLLLLPQTLTPQVPAGTIQGVVNERGRKEEVVWGASVELRQEGRSDALYGAVTDQDGKYVFPNVQPGRYHVMATRPGYMPAEYGQQRTKGPGLPLTILPGDQLNDVQISMTATAAISGRVSDQMGQPIALADVFALKASYQEGQRTLSKVLSAKTDERGEFRIFWLPPGSYYVDIQIPDGNFGSDLIVNPDGTDTAAMNPLTRNQLRDSSNSGGASTAPHEFHVPIYFPGTADPQLAQAVDVRPGADVSGVSIVVGVSHAFRIRGVVTNGVTGDPPGDTPTLLILVPVNPFQDSYTAQPDSKTGRFEMSQVVEGKYVLYARMIRPIAQSNTTELLWGSTPIEVRDGDVEDISIKPVLGVSMAGKVVIDGESGSSGNSLAAGMMVAVRPDPLLSQRPPSSSTIVARDGTFTLQGAPAGKYRPYILPLLSFNNPGILSALPSITPIPKDKDVYVKSIRIGGTDITQGGFRLSATQTGNMEIVLGTHPAGLKGRVVRTVDGSPKEAAGITVGIVPYLTEDRGFRTDMEKATLTDVMGAFQFNGLPPGDYKIFAWEDADMDAVADLDFIRKYEDFGTRIRVAEGSLETVELIMIPSRDQ